MADKELKIKITVDDTGAIQKIEGIDDAVDKAGKSADKAGDGFSKFQANLLTAEAALNLASRAFDGIQRVAAFTFDTLDRAAQVENLTRSFENLQESIGNNATSKLEALRESTRGLVSDQELLQQANQAVLLGVDDGSGKFEELSAAAIKLGQAQGITAAQAIESLTVGIGRQSKQVLDNLGIIVEAEKAYEAYALSIGKTVAQLTDQERRLAFNAAAFDGITKKAQNLAGAQQTAAQSSQGLSAQISNLRDRFATALSENEDLNKAIQNLSERLQSVNVEDLAADFAILASAVINVTEALAQLANFFSPTGITRNIRNIQIEVDALGGSLIFIREPLRDLAYEIAAVSKVAEPNAKTLDILRAKYYELREAVEAQTIILPAQTKRLGELREMILDYADKVENAASATSKMTEVFVRGIPAAASMTEQLKDVGTEAKKTADKIEKDLVEKSTDSGQEAGMSFSEGFGSSLQQSIGSIFDVALKGNSEQIAQEASVAVGSALGTGIGAYLGGPAGAQIGGQIGASLGELVGGAFEDNTNAESNARESFFQFIRNSIGQNEALILIENEFRPIKDLFTDLSRGIFNPGEGGAVPIFEELFAQAPEVQSAFLGVGEAIQRVFGNVDLVGGQVAALLNQRLGGSLQNLQVLIQQLGLSFQELEDSMIEAALNGETSFLEAESALRQIGQLAEQGIPGQIGAVTEAFNNLKAAGEQGGLFTVDALRDIGAEAAELGATTLQDLRAALEDAGVATDDLNKFFESLAEVGVDSVEELANVTDREAIQVLADLETLAFGFLETTNQAADDLISRLENIPEEIESRIVINVETRASDNGAQQVIDSGQLGLTL